MFKQNTKKIFKTSVYIKLVKKINCIPPEAITKLTVGSVQDSVGLFTNVMSILFAAL